MAIINPAANQLAYRYITNEAATQVLLGMGHDNGRVAARVLEDVMRARDPFEDPPFLFETAFYIAAVGEHSSAGWSRLVH
jgi:hypothetical protein